jgi:hypothetical protein
MIEDKGVATSADNAKSPLAVAAERALTLICDGPGT